MTYVYLKQEYSEIKRLEVSQVNIYVCQFCDMF